MFPHGFSIVFRDLRSRRDSYVLQFLSQDRTQCILQIFLLVIAADCLTDSAGLVFRAVLENNEKKGSEDGDRRAKRRTQAG